MRKFVVFTVISAFALTAFGSKDVAQNAIKEAGKKLETQKESQLQAQKELNQQALQANDQSISSFTAKKLKHAATIQRTVEKHKALAMEADKQGTQSDQAAPGAAFSLLEVPENLPQPQLRDTSVLGIKPDFFDPSQLNPVRVVKTFGVNGEQIASPLASMYTDTNINGALHRQSPGTTDDDVAAPLSKFKAEFKTKWAGIFAARFPVMNHYYFSKTRNYRYAFRDWFGHGFAGGYFYPVRPWNDVEKDFSYPIPRWLFSSDFAFAGSWFPTETLRTLSMDMSGLLGALVYRQEDFRTGMTLFTASLGSQLSENTIEQFTFGLGEIVLTHYENVRNVAIEMDGFVDRAGFHVPFKGLIDLENPGRTLAYLPHGPSPDLDANFFYLDQINRSLERLGWDTNEFFDEPAGTEASFPGVSCSTFSSIGSSLGAAGDLGSVDKRYFAFDEDGGAAYNQAINECLADVGAEGASTNLFECAANISCDDGVPYSEISVCTATSAGSSFLVHGRDPDLNARRAGNKCVADDSTTDTECTTHVTCTDSKGAELKTSSCTVTSQGKKFSAESFLEWRARSRAVENCESDLKTDDDQCRSGVTCSK